YLSYQASLQQFNRLLRLRRAPRSPPFPCTTLFRSLLVPLVAGLACVLLSGSAWLPRVALAGGALTGVAAIAYAARVVSGGEFLADRKSTRLNSSHLGISYAVFCLKKKTSTNAIPSN